MEKKLRQHAIQFSGGYAICMGWMSTHDNIWCYLACVRPPFFAIYFVVSKSVNKPRCFQKNTQSFAVLCIGFEWKKILHFCRTTTRDIDFNLRDDWNVHYHKQCASHMYMHRAQSLLRTNLFCIGVNLYFCATLYIHWTQFNVKWIRRKRTFFQEFSPLGIVGVRWNTNVFIVARWWRKHCIGRLCSRPPVQCDWEKTRTTICGLNKLLNTISERTTKLVHWTKMFVFLLERKSAIG